MYLKYLDAAKMRGKVGTSIRDEMNRLYVLHYYRLKEHHESFSVHAFIVEDKNVLCGLDSLY